MIFNDDGRFTVVDVVNAIIRNLSDEPPIQKTVRGNLQIPELKDKTFYNELARELDELDINLEKVEEDKVVFSITPLAHKRILMGVKMVLIERDFE